MSDRSNIIETIAKQEKFSTFARLMTSSGTYDVFSASGDFTVFVPTNEAFAKIPEARLNELLNETDQTKLKAMLSYHILSGKVMAANIASTPTRISFTGAELTFSDSNGLKVNGASVKERNLEATNGVVHGVDTVLQPSSSPTAVAAAAASGMPAAGSVTGSAIPTPVGTSDSSVVPVTPLEEAAKTETKPIF